MHILRARRQPGSRRTSWPCLLALAAWTGLGAPSPSRVRGPPLCQRETPKSIHTIHTHCYVHSLHLLCKMWCMPRCFCRARHRFSRSMRSASRPGCSSHRGPRRIGTAASARWDCSPCAAGWVRRTQGQAHTFKQIFTIRLLQKGTVTER